jgi:hypothetical protein
MAYAIRWRLAENERRREFIARHCSHLLTTGDEHQWAIYRVNPLPAVPGAAARPASDPAHHQSWNNR